MRTLDIVSIHKEKVLNILRLLILSVFLIGVMGCAKEKPQDESPASGGGGSTPPPATDSRGPDTSTNTDGSTSDPFQNLPGGSVSFLPVQDHYKTLTEYVMFHPVNSPSRFRLYVELSNNGEGRYAGSLKINYFDNNQWYSGNFDTGTGYNEVSYHDWYKGLPESEFNQWFISNGKPVFHAFFQDDYGAIILVVKDGVDQGDGLGYVEVNGSIWFKNFGNSRYPKESFEKCWFLINEVWGCPTFLNSKGKVQTNLFLEPKTEDGYKKLGDFRSLNVARAFGTN